MIENEIIDIVNEKDEVINTIEKNEAHKQWLLHRFVNIMIFSADKSKVLLQQRHHTKMSFPLLLDASAWGHINSWESYHSAANRELKEELWITCQLEEIADLRINNSKENMIWKLFIWYHNWPFEYQKEEIESIKLLTTNDLILLFEKFPYLSACNHSIQALIEKWII